MAEQVPAIHVLLAEGLLSMRAIRAGMTAREVMQFRPNTARIHSLRSATC